MHMKSKIELKIICIDDETKKKKQRMIEQNVVD